MGFGSVPKSRHGVIIIYCEILVWPSLENPNAMTGIDRYGGARGGDFGCWSFRSLSLFVKSYDIPDSLDPYILTHLNPNIQDYQDLAQINQHWQGRLI